MDDEMNTTPDATEAKPVVEGEETPKEVKEGGDETATPVEGAEKPKEEKNW